MRALAEFIMRGRFQAGLIAAIGNLVPFLSHAAVGLVTLRKGRFEGALVLLWAALPLLVTGFVSGTGVVITLASLAALALTIAAANVLGSTTSWSTTLQVTLLGSALIAILLGFGFGQQLLQIEQNLSAVFAEAAQRVAGEEAVFVVTRPQLLGIIAYVIMLNVFVSLLISRWWQALLYNPGGFKKEMHQLRIGYYPAAILLLGTVSCYMVSPDYISWAALLATPLLVSGLCLTHFAVAASGLGVYWLVLVYVGVFIFGPFSLILVVVGFADSLLNLRSKIPVKGS